MAQRCLGAVPIKRRTQRLQPTHLNWSKRGVGTLDVPEADK